MASIVSAGTTSSTALNMSADTSGVLQLASNNGTTAVTIGTDQNVTFAGSINAPNSFGFKNRIINGAMVIDQRNAGASVTQSSSVDVFPVDRFKINGNQNAKFTAQQNAGSVTPPTGFTNYLGITSSAATTVGSSDYFLLTHNVEGFNAADLGWGAAGASTVTMSFWVRSSLTGTFGGAIANSAFNRSYPFTYTISAANTWEQKSITIAGDTTGTWLKTNGTGLNIQFGLGVGSTYSGTAGAWAGAGYISATGATSVVGTNGATFYLTGTQLEKGSTATSFDYRPYGTELALCQRYYYTSSALSNTNDTTFNYFNVSNIAGVTKFAVSMRTAPTLTAYNGATANQVVGAGGGSNVTPNGFGGVSINGFRGVTTAGSFSSSPFPFYEFNFTANAEL
jgi:hypothetical protein